MFGYVRKTLQKPEVYQSGCNYRYWDMQQLYCKLDKGSLNLVFIKLNNIDNIHKGEAQEAKRINIE